MSKLITTHQEQAPFPFPVQLLSPVPPNKSTFPSLSRPVPLTISTPPSLHILPSFLPLCSYLILAFCQTSAGLYSLCFQPFLALVLTLYIYISTTSTEYSIFKHSTIANAHWRTCTSLSRFGIHGWVSAMYVIPFMSPFSQLIFGLTGDTPHLALDPTLPCSPLPPCPLYAHPKSLLHSMPKCTGLSSSVTVACGTSFGFCHQSQVQAQPRTKCIKLNKSTKELADKKREEEAQIASKSYFSFIL